MDPLLVGVLGVVAFILLLVFGVHIGIAMGVVGVLGLMILLGVKASVSTIATGAFHFITNAEFTVLPLFVLMGLSAMYGGISTNTFDGLSKLTGRLPGGLGIATVFGCTAFGTVCGASIVTATVFAKVSCPEMRRHGYDKRFAYGIVSSAGIIGMLIPPSTLALIYGLLTEESIGGLFIAGIGPGLLLGLLYIASIVIMVLLKPKLAPFEATRLTWRQRVTGLTKLWIIAVPALIVIGGIYGGVFTVSEAAAFGTLVVLIIAIFWGKMRWEQLGNALSETVGTMAMVFLILTAARVLARFLMVSGIAQYMANAIISMHPTTLILLLSIIVMYMILGCFLDSVSMLSITIPIIYPLIKAMEIEPMWFAMIAILSIEAGLITPPVGLNVFAVKAVAEDDVTLGDIFIGGFPFLFSILVLIGLVTAFPSIANWLPSHMF